MSRHASDPTPYSTGQAHLFNHSGTHFPRWMLGLEGTKIKGGIRLGHILGTGAFGAVYVGAGPRFADNRPVAVKILSGTPTDLQRRWQIEHEMLCHSRVSKHSNIVTLHTMFADRRAYYAVMDLHADGDMFKCITEDEIYIGDDALIKSVFNQLLDAVEFCHEKGVYHRDLKPENILCRNGGKTILLTDFGLATRNTFSRAFRCGSEFYMSPECAGSLGVEAYSTVHNDIWALGVILVNLATSRNPWKCAESQDEMFVSFCEDATAYITNTLPVSRDTLSLLLRIFTIPYESRILIPGIRAAITSIDRFLLTPAEASFAPSSARQAAEDIFDIIAAQRPHVLTEYYGDICAYFPDLAEDLCKGLRLDMSEHGLIIGIDDIFSENAPEPVRYTRQELAEWSVPIPIEIRPKKFEDIVGYPQSPDMSRDNSAETVASGGPITPDTHPIRVVDDVPEVTLDGAEYLEGNLDERMITKPAELSPVIPPSSFSSRIARVLGSTGSFFR